MKPPILLGHFVEHGLADVENPCCSIESLGQNGQEHSEPLGARQRILPQAIQLGHSCTKAMKTAPGQDERQGNVLEMDVAPLI